MKSPKNFDILQGRDTGFRTNCLANSYLPCVHYPFCFCFLIKTNGDKNNVEKSKMQFFKDVLGSGYLQEEKLKIIMIFSTCVKKNQFFLQFSGKCVPTQEMCPYPKSEGWKQKQYFLRAPASCQNCLLPTENIKGNKCKQTKFA